MDWELIFWIVGGIVAFGILMACFWANDDSIEITDGKRRDWEREERKWR